ncbi:hypothetical protein [Lyngbya sp. CCY1209]|uniref:hypothetical protein n=1 Tax=Lyngbya sp. CCY1209 TaxID=2886103 RepID=UPI002D2011C7|nr:hypothetical protein [Lyngbya sp. CCY1209]MEB3883067.1 hypothetical protein [Lyngbya sp. CCY1209]
MHVYQTEDPRLMNVKETLECPKCGKRCLVEKASNHYHCLWCHFDRNLNDTEDGNAIAFVIGILLIMVLMFVVTSANNRSRDRSFIPDSGTVEVAIGNRVASLR